MSLLSIGEILVDKELLIAFFSCDFLACKGQCCVDGELGAPLSVEEAQLLEHVPEEVLRMLPERGLRHLRRHGAVELYKGVHYSKTVDGAECVFTMVRNGVTLCALEVARQEGMIAFHKPISCRLFPIRVRKKFGLDYLVYEQHPMCRAARQAGEADGVPLISFVAEPLKDLYGDAWFNEMKTYVDLSKRS